MRSQARDLLLFIDGKEESQSAASRGKVVWWVVLKGILPAAGKCGKDVCRVYCSYGYAISIGFIFTLVPRGQILFSLLSILGVFKNALQAFACPEAAFRSGPIHKKGKHGLWYCKNDLLRASLNFYNTKVNKAPFHFTGSPLPFFFPLLGKLVRP